MIFAADATHVSILFCHPLQTVKVIVEGEIFDDFPINPFAASAKLILLCSSYVTL